MPRSYKNPSFHRRRGRETQDESLAVTLFAPEPNIDDSSLPLTYEAPYMTTKEILDHHWDAFTTQDLDMVMEDYDEGSVVITNMGTFRGLDEIEGLFTNIFDEFSQAGSTAELEMEEIEGDTAYIVWHGETPDNDYAFCTDTFRIDDGVITMQTFAGDVQPK